MRHVPSVFTTGYFRGETDFNPQAGADVRNVVPLADGTPSEDAFLVKLAGDATGTYVLDGHLGQHRPRQCTRRRNGRRRRVYVTGFVDEDVDLDPSTGGSDPRTNLDSYDAFVVKLDASGGYAWGETWGGAGSGSEQGQAVAVAPDGAVVVAGLFGNAPVDFDPGLASDSRTSAGVWDAFVAKYDALGNYLWVRTWGGTGADLPYRVAIDADGAIVVVGQFQNDLDFDPGDGVDERSVVSGYDRFVTKLDADGDYLWARTVGGIREDSTRAVALAPDGTIFVSGYFGASVDFGPEGSPDVRTTAASHEPFVWALSADGEHRFVRTFPTAAGGNAQAYALARSPEGAIVIGGWFTGEVDFDPGAGLDLRTPEDDYDAFVTKLVP